MSQLRHGAAAFCYGWAWLLMAALIGMVAIAELLQGEGVAADRRDSSRDANTVARSYVMRPFLRKTPVNPIA